MSVTATMKTCSKCKIEKLEVAFSKDDNHKDNLASQCKDCDKNYRQVHKKEAANYRQAHKKEMVAYQVAYRKTPISKEADRKKSAEKRKFFPEKMKAHNAINSTITAGKLKRSVFCEECGLPAKTEGHHADYSKPLEVNWLCPDCHRKKHKNLILV